jgi:hypothetical protein
MKQSICTDPTCRIAKIFEGILSAALLMVCCGCIYLGPSIPVRVPVKTKDISGNVRELDFTFLKAGQTSRQEVAKNLAPIATTTKERGFFWGRWESSSWVSAPLIAPYPPLGGRDWGPQNILITFDQNDPVQGWKVLKDKDLFRELDQLESTHTTPLDLSSPVRLKVELPYDGQDSRPAADLVLTAPSLEYEGLQHGFQLERGSLAKITSAPEDTFTDPTIHHELDPAHIWVTLHFTKRTRLGKSLTCGLDPAGFLVLRRYLREAKK